MVDRRVLAALGLAVLLTTAGCSALPFGGNDNPLSDENPGVDTDVEYPPGVTDAGVENQSDLLSVHHNRLSAEGSFTLEHSQTVSEGDEVVQTQSRELKLNNRSALVVTQQDGETTERAWSNGSQTVQEVSVQTEDGEKKTRPVVREGAFNVGPYMSERAVSSVVVGFDYQTKATEELRGQTVFKLTSTSTADENVLKDTYRASAIRNASSTLWVNSQGQILKMDVTVDMLDQNGQRVTVEDTYTVKNVGETTVGEPDWVTQAREDATKFSGELSDDQQYLEITHEGGEPLDGALLQVYVADNQLRTTTDLTISEGDTLYAYVTEEGDFMLKKTPPGDDTSVQQLPDLRVEFYTQDQLPAGAAQDQADNSSE